MALLLATLSLNAQKPQSLFNGKNLDGWNPFTKNLSETPSSVYSVKDKCIDISGEFGYLYTDNQYSDYKLTLEWRWVGEATNSGVFIHMRGENKAWPNCYEMQLAAGKAGDIIHAGEASSAEFAESGKKVKKAFNEGVEKPVGEWNKMEVVSKAGTVTVYVNGVKQNQITKLSQTSGHIGLQSEGKAIQFRAVELIEL